MRWRYARFLGALGRTAAKHGPLHLALQHFLKVTRSFWPGLFHCYSHPDVPRTNNDLEHLFGAYRYHERRATGRKVASPATVLRGSVRIIAATATRYRAIQGVALAPTDLQAWQKVRRGLNERRYTRTLGRRFRCNPGRHLRSLERLLAAKSALPP
jgi:hypothetical protein